ncbi:hypothetical protein BOKEGFJH_00384 [Chlamydia avium]|nr:hypothetical protein BOKEGFJH_00384 [Chlamydia avium]
MAISSYVQMDSLLDFHSHLGNTDASPLSPEARGVRAPLTTQQTLLDAAEDALRSMEQTDLKKARLYKVALGIITVIGLAILFVIPVAMVFGISIWLPIVITVGFSLFLGVLGNTLRTRYQRIRLRYQFLQVYHKQLCSRHSNLKNSTLAKYHIQLPKTKDSLKTQLLSKLRPDLHAQPSDGGASLDDKLGLLGEINSRYQCEAVAGIDNQDQEVTWNKCLSEVLKAKAELLKNTSAQPTLVNLANSSLQETGIDFSLLPQKNFLDVAQSLINICGFGSQIGEETLQYLDQYDRLNMHSKTLMSWGGNFSPATRLYLSQGRATVDFALNTLSTLQSHVSKVKESLWLSEFIKWKEKICSFINDSQESRDLYQQIVQEAHKLNIHEGVSEEKQQAVRQVLRQLDGLFNESENNKSEEIRNQLDAITKSSIEILGGDDQTSLKDICNQVQTKFVEYLISLGEQNLLFDKIHLSIQLGKCVRKDIQQAIAKHPENQCARILHTLDQLTTLLNQDSWGAISGKPVEKILEEKQVIRDQLNKIYSYVDTWKRNYEEFKSQKITRILMKDFLENYSSLDSVLARLHSVHTDTSGLDNFVDSCREFLNGSFDELGGREAIPNPEEISAWSQEYTKLISELEAILPDCQSIVDKVRGQCTTGGQLIVQALTNKESTLSGKIKEKEKELVSAIKLNHQSSPRCDERTLLARGGMHMKAILECMKKFEESVRNPQQIVVENIIQSSNDLFAVMRGPEVEALVELENLLALRSDEDLSQSSVDKPSESIAHTLHGAQKSARNFWEKRNQNLDALLNKLQKNLNKWNLAQSLVSGILGIALLVVSLSLLSLQFVWLPVGIAAIALVLQIIPMLFSRVIEKKVLDVSAAKLAKEFLFSTKILPSEFGNQNLDHFANVQNVLQLEGYEQLWAKETIQDVHGDLSAKNEDFKNTVKQLKKDARSLDKKMKKLWGNNLEENLPYSSDSETFPIQMESLTESISDKKKADSIAAEISHIESMENQIVCSRLRHDLEMVRHKQQVSYYNQLKTYLETHKEDIATVQQELIINETLSRVISQAIAQSAPSTEVDPKEISSIVDLLVTLTASIYNSNSSEERKSAKQSFDAHIKSIADRGLLLIVRDALELSSCLGKSEIHFDTRRRHALARLQGASSVISENDANLSVSREESLSEEKEVEDRKTLFKYLGIGYLSPFVEFSSSSLSRRGHSLAKSALVNIKLLQSKLSIGETISVEEYKRTHRALSSYLKMHRQLSPLAYGRLLGNENSMKSAHMMREAHSLQEIIKLNTLLGNQELCALSIQRLENWLSKLANKREYLKLFTNLIQRVRSGDISSSNEQEYINDLCTCLRGVPVHLLYHMQKKYKAQSLICVEKLQQFQETYKRMQYVSQKVNEKEQHISLKQEAITEEMNALDRNLKELQARKAELTSKKQ